MVQWIQCHGTEFNSIFDLILAKYLFQYYYVDQNKKLILKQHYVVSNGISSDLVNLENLM